MYFYVFDYSFNVCACAEIKHVQLLCKLNGYRFALCYWFCRLVDQRTNIKNMEVPVINTVVTTYSKTIYYEQASKY